MLLSLEHSGIFVRKSLMGKANSPLNFALTLQAMEFFAGKIGGPYLKLDAKTHTIFLIDEICMGEKEIYPS